MRYWLLTPFLFLLVRADTEAWVNPVPLTDSTSIFSTDPIWPLGSKQVLVWETSFSSVSICLYQDNNNTFQYVTENQETDNSSTTQSLTWIVGDLLDSSGNIVSYQNFRAIFPDTSTPFLFYFFETGATSGIGSSFVNFTAPLGSTDSTTSPTTSPTSSVPVTSHSAGVSTTPTADQLTTTTSESTATATTTAAPSSSSGLSSGAKAGIGIGVSLGAIAVLAGIALYFWRRNKTAKMSGVVNPEIHNQNSNPLLPPQMANAGMGVHEVNGSVREVGMGGEVRSELPPQDSYGYYAPKAPGTVPEERHELDGYSQQGRSP